MASSLESLLGGGETVGSLLTDPGATALGDNPYIAMVKALAASQQNVPAPRNDFESFLIPLVQGGSLGVATALARDRQKDNLFDYYKNNPLIQQLAGSAGKLEDVGPVIDPEEYVRGLQNAPLAVYNQAERPDTWQPEEGKGALLKALVGYQAQQDAAKAAQEIDLFKKKKEIEQEIKSNAESGIGTDPYKLLSADEKTRYAGVPSVAQKLEELADKALKLDQSAASLALSRQVGGSKYNEIRSELENYLPVVRKAFSDTGNAALGEQVMSMNALMGDITSGSKTIARNLKNAANTLRTTASESLQNRIAGIQQGAGATLASIVGGKKSPPPPIPGESFEDYKRRVSSGF